MSYIPRILGFVFLSSIAVAGMQFVPLHAQDLQFDQRCFTADQCKERRESLGLDPDEGFIPNNNAVAACSGVALMNSGAEVGFCSAGSEITTISGFGGRRSFDGIADFIVYIFRFSFTIATALAVIMVLVSGIQWMSSGGNSSVIDDAKKRIGGAILGLFLLVLSYTILRTINPALVSFRPLEIYMINAIKIAPEFCSEFDTDLTFYKAAESGTVELTPLETSVQGGGTTLEQLQARPGDHCGDQYYIAGAGTQTCRTDICPNPEHTCAPITISGDNVTVGQYSCIDAEYVLKLDVRSFDELKRQVGTSIPIVGSLVTYFTDTLSGKNWLDANAISVFPVCQYITTDYQARVMIPYQSTGLRYRMIDPIPGSSLGIRQIEKESTNPLSTLSEYYIIINDLTARMTQACAILDEGRATSAGKSVEPIGFILQIRLNSSNVISFDHDLYLGQNGTIQNSPSNVEVMFDYFRLHNPQPGATVVPYSIQETHLENSYNYRQDACFFNNDIQYYTSGCGALLE